MTGNWTLFFSWFCSGSYGSAEMIFDAAGTWKMPTFGYTGRWAEGHGELIFNFDGHSTVYAGHLAGNAAVGLQTTFVPGETGCWYLIKQGGQSLKAGDPGTDPIVPKKK